MWLLLQMCAWCPCVAVIIVDNTVGSPLRPITLFSILHYTEGFPATTFKKKETTPAAPCLYTHTVNNHHHVQHLPVCSLPVNWQMWQMEVEADWLACVQFKKALHTWTHSRWMTQWCSTSERRNLMTLTCVCVRVSMRVRVRVWSYRLLTCPRTPM